MKSVRHVGGKVNGEKSIVYILDHEGAMAIARAGLLVPGLRRLALCLPVGCLLDIVAGIVAVRAVNAGDSLTPTWVLVAAANTLCIVGFVYITRIKRLYDGQYSALQRAYPLVVTAGRAVVIEMLQRQRVRAAVKHGSRATELFMEILKHYASGEEKQARLAAGVLNDLARD